MRPLFDADAQGEGTLQGAAPSLTDRPSLTDAPAGPNTPSLTDALALARLLLPDEEPRSATPCAGGRNSRVFRLDMADGPPRILKFYPCLPLDDRDRLGTEWRALRFLHEHHLTTVPQPLAMDRQHNAAVYSFIAGQSPAPVSAALEAAAPLRDFVLALWPLRHEALRRDMPPASAACFSLSAIARQVERRCARLLEACAAHAAHHTAEAAPPELCRTVEALLTERVLPQIRHALCEAALWLDVDAELPQAARIPSPSDFGFHNAVLSPQGVVHFIDFEYFGMDDPAKLLADVCWHPGMLLSHAQRQWFVEQILQKIGEDADAHGLARRLHCVLPLWRCQWVCIVFNCLLTHRVPRTLLQAQLTKALALLESHVPELAPYLHRHHARRPARHPA